MTVRRRLVEALERDPGLQVVGEAGDGKAAIELCQSLKPDLVSMDMMLPEMTGLAVTEYVMAYCPTPILVVSASTNRGELYKTYEALAAGAVDVLEKPVDGDEAWDEEYRARVRLVARIKVITHPRARLSARAEAAAGGLPAAPAAGAGEDGALKALAIGASTGGPGALRQILSGLPADFPLPLLLVIHIGRAFGAAMADWLDGISRLRVAWARDGEPLPAPGQGRVLMAPPDHHLVLEAGRLRLTQAPERHSCRPSVDVLFESLARELGARCAACLLTGMGRDGASGLLALRQAGARTFAQDEESCVVWGMPREAVLLGAAERVLPLDRMAGALAAVARGKGREAA